MQVVCLETMHEVLALNALVIMPPHWRLTGTTGTGMNVDHGPSRQRREVDDSAIGSRQAECRQPRPRQVIAGAIVDRDGKFDWKVPQITRLCRGATPPRPGNPRS